MVFHAKITPEKCAYITYLVKDKGFKITEICKKTGISRATIYRIKKSKDFSKNTSNRTQRNITKKNKRGRPKKLSDRDERNIIRSIKVLRQSKGNFSAVNIMSEAGIQQSLVHARTVRRCLNKNGYHSLQARKKGLLSLQDCKKRLKFAKDIKKNYAANLWTDCIAFYLDGVSFTFKTRPKEQAIAPRGRIWRKRSEGLTRGCTAKGRKECTGGKLVKVIVAITYNYGVIEVFEYEQLDGPFFADFVRQRFPVMFTKASKNSRLFLQDNAPNQNAYCVQTALRRVRAKQINFPPRSGDLNPIENVFKNVKQLLHRQAISDNIEHETFNEFRARVVKTLKEYPVNEINKTIASMNKRIQMVIEKKGDRTKY